MFSRMFSHSEFIQEKYSPYGKTLKNVSGIILELDCGANLFTNPSGFINLPRNPTNFLATVNCTYTISTNRTSHIWLKTSLNSHMQLFQSFKDCDRESLTVGCVHSFVDFKTNFKTDELASALPIHLISRLLSISQKRYLYKNSDYIRKQTIQRHDFRHTSGAKPTDS